MSEGLTGWNPDPWSVHEFRYFSMGGTPTRLVKDGERTSYDAPPFASPANDRTMAAVPPPPHEFTCEPKCAISDLLADLIQSTHRKLAVADMEEDTVRVAYLREQIELWERLVRLPARGTESARRDIQQLRPQQSLPAPGAAGVICNVRTEYQMAGQRSIPEGVQRLLRLRIAGLPAVDPQRVKDAAPPIQPPTTRSTPTQPHRADKAIPTIPSEAANSPPFRARKHTKTSKTSKTFRIISWTLGFGVLLVSVLATIHDFERTTFHVAKISHTVLNPQDIEIHWTVLNTGKHAGTPNCEVKASSPGDADTGSDTATGLKSLRAGGQQTASTTLTITNSGADHVTNVSVAC